MISSNWIDANAACALLGVKPQTLYAYVSRGLLRAVGDPDDPRRSLYDSADVTRLAAQHRRPRARADVAAGALRWGDPVLATAISAVRDGRLCFGAVPAVDLAERLSLEDVAAHHWGVRPPEPSPGPSLGQGSSPLGRAMAHLSARAETAFPMAGRTRAEIAAEGSALLAEVITAFVQEPADAVPAHMRLAQHWGAADQGAQVIRQALVLISDHDLNPSTFAVRVCASTGASLPASLLAGLATLSEPRHGGVGALAQGNRA